MGLVGKRLKAARLAKEKTQKEVADFLGVTPKMISFYENEERDPTTETLSKISEFLHISTDWLLGNDAPSLSSNKNSPYSKENLLAQFGEEDQKLLLDYIEFLKNRKKDPKGGQ